MNRSKRYGVLTVLAIFLLPIAVASCILVVEEDDYDRHHRHGIGVDWYVEVVFHKAQAINPTDHDVEFSFVDETHFEGISECGVFRGTYEIGDQDEVVVHGIDSDGAECDGDGLSAVFLNELAYAERVDRNDDELRIETRGDNYILLTEEK